MWRRDEIRLAEAVTDGAEKRIMGGAKRGQFAIVCVVCRRKITGSLLEHHHKEHNYGAGAR